MSYLLKIILFMLPAVAFLSAETTKKEEASGDHFERIKDLGYAALITKVPAKLKTSIYHAIDKADNGEIVFEDFRDEYDRKVYYFLINSIAQELGNHVLKQKSAAAIGLDMPCTVCSVGGDGKLFITIPRGACLKKKPKE